MQIGVLTLLSHVFAKTLLKATSTVAAKAGKAATTSGYVLRQQGNMHVCKALKQACLASFLLAHLLYVQVSADHAEHVHMLPLVLVNALDLDIVQGIGGHLSPCNLLQSP